MNRDGDSKEEPRRNAGDQSTGTETRTATDALGRTQVMAEKGISKLEDISFATSKVQSKMEQNRAEYPTAIGRLQKV